MTRFELANNGFADRLLWPLGHIALVLPAYHRSFKIATLLKVFGKAESAGTVTNQRFRLSRIVIDLVDHGDGLALL